METGRRLFFASSKEKTLSPQYISYTLMLSNFVGICFARTLHYQFYVWYFHALPYLLWSSSPSYTDPSLLLTYIVILGNIEMCFLTFPATVWSSAALQVCHFAVLLQTQLQPTTPICIKCDSDENRQQLRAKME